MLFRKFSKVMVFARPFWHLYILSALLSGAMMLLALVSPWLTKLLLDDVLINRKFDLFLLVLIGFITIYIATQLLSILNTLLTTKLSQRQQRHIKLAVYDRLQHLNLGFFYKKRVGDLLARIDMDAYSIERFINTIVYTLIISTANFAAIIYLSLRLNTNVTLLALSVLPVYIISELTWVKRLKRYAQDLLSKNADIFSFLQEGLSGIKAVKLFTREREMYNEYAEKIDGYNKVRYKNVMINSLSEVVNGFIFYLPSFAVLAYGGYQVILGFLTIGGMIALQQYIGRLFGPITSFISLNRSLQLDMVSINRLFEIFDTPPEVEEKAGAAELNYIAGNIEFRNVKFQYEPEQPLVLNGITEHIPAGRRIGLVGPSGVGKSTLVNLIFRFYDPTEGAILLDGIDIRDIKLRSLRSHIGFVSQESIIFNRTIRENILFGKPDADMDEVRNAIKIAGLSDVIARLPAGYETVVGERGEMLSAGERQRLSIARVVLENPEIIILDEPTSSLDAETERRVRDALDYVTRGKTTIVIAHRLSTLTNVDEIWVLTDGQIIEKGDFYTLLKKRGNFFNYHLDQFGGFEMFRVRLATELERAERQKMPLSVIKVAIANWEQLDRDPLAGNELISGIVRELSRNLYELYFAADAPYKRGIFFVVLPEVDKIKAAQAIHEIRACLKKYFPDINPSIQIVFSSSAISEEDRRVVEQLIRNDA